MSDTLRLLTAEMGQVGVVSGDSIWSPIGLTVPDEKQIHNPTLLLPE